MKLKKEKKVALIINGQKRVGRWIAMRVSFLIKNLTRLLCMVISFFFDARIRLTIHGTCKCNQSEFLVNGRRYFGPQPK